MSDTYQIRIRGQVQGVGFRPHVYGLAKKMGLTGEVYNDTEGVVIHLNTSLGKAENFLEHLVSQPPPVAVIRSHTLSKISPQDYGGFSISTSISDMPVSMPLTSDFAICKKCKEEIEDPENRRYHYPFTTCVHCGPRYAITQQFPFERVHTTLHNFLMCSTCADEYENPENRRFHSQTNSCSDCGVQLSLTDAAGAPIGLTQKEIVPEVAKLLSQQQIVAIKNVNGYLLCCDARNAETVARLRKAKRRPNKPFAILYPSLALLKAELSISPTEEELLSSKVAPIVIVSSDKYQGALVLSSIAPGLDQLGVMLPSSGLLHMLTSSLGFPIVATSGNIHGSPILSEEGKAQIALQEVADHFLHHNLPIHFPQDDSVIKVSKKHQHKMVFRRARGMAPNYLDADIPAETSIIAMGGDLKSSFTITARGHCYVSPYFGDMASYDVWERYSDSVKKYQALFQITPKVVLVDLHQGYQSSTYGKDLAKKWNAKLYEIPHHKAHFASVLGEHQLFEREERILGVVWDGLGWGEDGNIWGGEFFIYHQHKMERVAHLEYFDWIAGDRMSKEPRMSLLSLAEENLARPKFDDATYQVYRQLLPKNTLKTSSAGRLFDATASLLGICDINSFEGEAAMLLEAQALRHKGSLTNYLERGGVSPLDTRSLIRTMHEDVKHNVSVSEIAASFHFTLAHTIVEVAHRQGCTTIACSGGVFQNTLLVDMLISLVGDRFFLKFNRTLSVNDENIGFGQIQYYKNILQCV